MKRIAWVTALLLSLILCLSVPALAAEDAEAGGSAAPAGTEEGLPALQADVVGSGKCGENTTWTLDSDGLLTIFGTGPMEDYSEFSTPVPQWRTYEIVRIQVQEGVTSIGDAAFCDHDELIGVSLPDGLESIGKASFKNCKSLMAVETPKSVKSIGDEAFEFCEGMLLVKFGSNLESIGKRAFNNCNRVKEIIIPSTVKSIGEGAFSGCKSLEDIFIPDSVESMGDRAFSGCENLTRAIIGSGVEAIGNGVFSSCKKLSRISILEGVKSIGDSAFAFSGLTGELKLPESLTSIGECAFQYVTGLAGAKLSLPKGLTTIGKEAFNGCPGFSELILPEGLTSIGEGAFQNWESLHDIKIPGSVKNIGDSAFAGCTGMYDLQLEEGIESIGQYAFKDCVLGGRVTIPDGVIQIGYGAFQGTRTVTYDLPGSIRSIGSYSLSSFTDEVNYGGTREQWLAVNGHDYVEKMNRGHVTIYYSETPYPIPVDSVSISPYAATVFLTEVMTLRATVSPDNAMDKTVTWSSNNPSVVTVDKNGRIKGVSIGTAVITANASGKTATCTVTVKLVDYDYTNGTLTLDAGAVDLIPGMSDVAMGARPYSINDLTDPQIWWRILDPDVALLSNRASAFGEQAGEIYTPVTGIQDPAILIHPKSYGTTVVIATLVQKFVNGYTRVGNPAAFTVTMHRPEEMVKVQPKLSIGVGQTKTIRVELAVKGLSTTGTGWEYGTQETSDCMVKILKTEKEEDSNNILLTVQGVKAGQTSLGPCMLYDGKVVAATARDCAVTVTQTPAAPTYSMGPGGEVTVEREGRRINVLTGPVSGKQPLWAASYDPRGKLISLQKLTSPAASATVPAGAGRCKLMWLDEKSAPKCGNLEFTF